jgi:hypothetical protein
VPYCSLRCYKAHSETCSEDFYKDQCYAYLRGTKATDETVKQMHGLLHDYNSADSIDHILTEKQEARLHQIVKQIDRDHSVDLLTYAEQQEFASSLLNGQLTEEVSVWVPWWEEEAKHPGVAEVGSEDPRYTSVPEFSTLSKKAPGVWLEYHLANLLWSVAYAWRAYNGDLEYNEHDIYALLLTISDVFAGRAGQEIHSLDTAVLAASTKAQSEDSDLASQLIPIVSADLGLILAHKAHIVKSLFAVADLLQSLQIISKTQVKPLRKKLMFWLSYVKSYR